jgi:AhpD family alkylhydroperoxidase
VSGAATIGAVEWETPLLEPRRDPALEQEVRLRSGFVPPLVHYFTACPWLVRSVPALEPYRVGLVHMDFALADLVGLVVSQDNSCRFCYATQRTLLRAQGLSERRIRALEQDVLAAQGDARGRSALEFARRVSGASPPPGAADRARLHDTGFGEEAIAELAFTAAVQVYFNRIATLPAVPVQRIERLSHHWVLALAAPITSRLIRRTQSRGAPRAVTPEMRAGPFGALVERLDPLPAAHALRGVIDDALASPVLPRRAKLLVFAVVARGLGCGPSEREAIDLLAGEGLDPKESDRVLTHLGSPALSPLESALVPFARETIRYQPAAIQRRLRLLAPRLVHAELVELIGVTSLANALCRLRLALEAP